MPDEEAREFAEAKRGLVVAPAGCGKTELIVRAVQQNQGRQLILTHTHAGVRALRNRLKKLGVSSKCVQVDTIDGWTLKYAHAFSTLSGLGIRKPPDVPWHEIRDAGIRALKLRAARRVVARSFTGAYIDEYQDCSERQHALLVILDEIVGCKVVGDPLQAIFGFDRSNPLADWSSDVVSYYQPLFELQIPWRWKDHNAELGRWLLSARQCIIEQRPLDLSVAAVKWCKIGDPRSHRSAQLNECHRLGNCDGESVVAIHNVNKQCHAVGKNLKGRYTCLEPIHSRDLLDSAAKIGQASGHERVVAVIDFAQMCLTKCPDVLRSLHHKFSSGKLPTSNMAKKYPDLRDALTETAISSAPAAVWTGLDAIDRLPGIQFHRRELWRSMRKAAEIHSQDATCDLRESAIQVREQVRHSGRSSGRRTIATTLLIKGLEFDHAIVLDADRLRPADLYVALTRGAKSLAIFISTQTIKPRHSRKQ
jgi:AAA domain